MKLIRILALLLVAVTILSVLPAQAAATVDTITFNQKLDELRDVFVHEEYWNGYNKNGYESSGPIACPSCSDRNRYSCGGCSDNCGAFYYNGKKVASQCLGFAYKLGSLIFGGNPISWEKHKDISRLRPGDILYGNLGPMFNRTTATHGVFVIAVTNDTVTFADCNWNGPCRIRWDKTVERSKVADSLTGANIYHAPNNGVGMSPEMTLTMDSQLMMEGATAEIKFTRPSGGTLKLLVEKKNEEGKYETVITHTPTSSPFTVGTLPRGEYRFTLKYTNNSKKLSCTIHPLVYTPQTMPFVDVKKSAWFYKNNSVSFVYSQGYFAGMSPKEFGPYNGMTRSMFVTVLSRMAGAEVDNEAATAFTDVPTGTWYTGAVAWGDQTGIVSGVGKKRFAPDEMVTREQICALLVRYSAFCDITLPQKTNVKFVDEEKISDWVKESVLRCAAAGIIRGNPEADGMHFAPTKTATRAEVATILYGYMNNI